MGWGVTPYQDYKVLGYAKPFELACIAYGKRFVREWFGQDIDPHEIYGAWECGWHSFVARFQPGETKTRVHVGYKVSSSPSWRCKALGVEPIVVPNFWGQVMIVANSDPHQVFVSGDCWNYPIHPSVCYSIERSEQNLNFSLDSVGRLVAFYSYAKTYGSDDCVHVFFNPAASQDQPTPKREFNGPTDDQMNDLASALLEQNGVGMCDMFSILKDSPNSLLSVVGDDQTLRKNISAMIKGMIKDKPWAWINAGRKNT